MLDRNFTRARDLLQPVLVDTDVASALFLERYHGPRVPAALAGSLATRRLPIGLITLGEAH
jgi:hypothetical protein